MKTNIVIKGASEHNLKNIDLEFPRDRLVVFTGVSGSGKSSLAFDTLYACLLYTSDAADDLLCVDLGGRRIIKKNNKNTHVTQGTQTKNSKRSQTTEEPE